MPSFFQNVGDNLKELLSLGTADEMLGGGLSSPQAGCLAASLAFKNQMPIAPPSYDNQDVFEHCQIFPGRQKSSPAEDHLSMARKGYTNKNQVTYKCINLKKKKFSFLTQ